MKRVVLPDGKEVFCLRELEARQVYGQVRGYFKHGVEIGPGAVVFDVGANIGLFTRWVHEICAGDVQVFCFEPIPATFEVLRANVGLLCSDSLVPFNCGLGREPGELRFAYFPNWTVMSTAYSDDVEELKEQLEESILRNIKDVPPPANRLRFLPPFLRRRLLGAMIARSFEPEEVICRIRTVSEIIRENEVEVIDLLKVDVEKSELDVLGGIEDADWARIRQAVLEVHDLDGRLAEIEALLASHGLEQITVEQEPALKDSGIYTVFARK